MNQMYQVHALVPQTFSVGATSGIEAAAYVRGKCRADSDIAAEPVIVSVDTPEAGSYYEEQPEPPTPSCA